MAKEETVVELKKALREAQEAARIKDMELNKARKNAKPTVQTEPPIVVDNLVFEMPELERVAMIRALKNQMRSLLAFAPEDIRKTKNAEYLTTGTLVKAAVEEFVKRRSKTSWTWAQCNFGAKAPDKFQAYDFVEICLSHPAHIKSGGPDPRNWAESVTPEPRDALMRAKIYRHEVESI